MTSPSATASSGASTATPGSPSTTPATKGTTSAEVATTSRLQTDDGKISVASSVVQKIAGIAAREVSGVYKLGGGAARAFGAIRERIPGSGGPNVTQGVSVEVGERQAAIDLDIVIEYGVSIADLGRAIQRNVKGSVERMCGLEVTEVNISVDDVHLPGSSSDDQPPAEPTPARVQ